MKKSIILFSLLGAIFLIGAIGLNNNLVTIDDNGNITSNGLTSNKVVFTGEVPPFEKGMIYWDSTQRCFKGWEYIVLRSIDMTHAIVAEPVVDSNSIAETIIYTVAQGAKYPAVNKQIEINLHGVYTTSAGTPKTVKFRIKRGTTVLDSLTTADMAAVDQHRELKWYCTYLAVGDSVRTSQHLQIEFDGEYENFNNNTINTLIDNTITITVQISAVGNNYVRLLVGHTTTRN